MNDFQKLEMRVKVLEEENENLKFSNRLPISLENSISSRGFPKFEAQEFLNQEDYDSLGRNIELSGDAETIRVPAYPYKYVKLAGGQNFYIPLYILAES